MSSTSIPPESDSQLQPHNGAEKEESVSPLQSHLNYLHSPTTPLSTVVQAVHWLLLNPDFHLTPSISPTGKRLITLTSTASADATPSLAGTADLNTLGRIHLASATRCRDEHASLKTRLLHVSLDEPIEKLYDASQKLLREGLDNGTVRFPPLSKDEMDECPCCRGDPDAVILFGFHHGNGLYFEEDEYRAIWGDQEYHGLWSGSDGTWLMARKEMVERMVEAEEEKNKGVSKL